MSRTPANAAAIAGFMTQKPGICLTVSAPGFLNGLTALANATTNCFPMILVSGSSEREIVDLQQGDYEEMDQLAVAKPLAKAAFRVLHAEDIGWASRAPSAPPSPAVRAASYLDLPAKLFAQTMDCEAGKKSLIKVVDRRPSRSPAPTRSSAPSTCLKGAKKPLIVLARVPLTLKPMRTSAPSSRRPAFPTCRCPWPKGLLPDTHEQCASAARSFVLPEADVVMLIGARLNWLLSHGKGKTWGGKDHKEWGGQQFIQIDISPQEADSNVRIDAPLSATSAPACPRCSVRLAPTGPSQRRSGSPPSPSARTRTLQRLAETLAKNPVPMNFHSALAVVRDIVKANPDACLVNEGANALDFTRSIVDMYKPRKRLDVGTWGIMGIRPWAFRSRPPWSAAKPVIAIEGDSAFGFSGMEVETICRYNLPVCVVVFNNNGVYRGTDVNPTGAPTWHPPCRQGRTL